MTKNKTSKQWLYVSVVNADKTNTAIIVEATPDPLAVIEEVKKFGVETTGDGDMLVADCSPPPFGLRNKILSKSDLWFANVFVGDHEMYIVGGKYYRGCGEVDNQMTLETTEDYGQTWIKVKPTTEIHGHPSALRPLNPQARYTWGNNA